MLQSAAYMPMPPNHHDPTCLTPGFAGAPAMNGQRLYMPSPHSSVGLGPRMPSSGAPLRAAPSLPFGYFPLAPPTPEGVTAAAMCPTATPGPFSGPHGPSLLPPDQQSTTGRKTEPTTTKKKRTKTTKVRCPSTVTSSLHISAAFHYSCILWNFVRQVVRAYLEPRGDIMLTKVGMIFEPLLPVSVRCYCLRTLFNVVM